MNRFPRAFTLLEMLLAVTLASVLLAAGLGVAASLSRDMAVMQRGSSPISARTSIREPASGGGETVGAGAMTLIRHDLSSAIAIVETGGGDGLVLVGHCAIDGQSLEPQWRLCCVEYRLQGTAGRPRTLIRRQVYLDDPIRPQAWSEVVALEVRSIAIVPTGAAPEGRTRLGEGVEVRLRQALGRPLESAPLVATEVPSRVRVRIERAQGIEAQDVVLK